MKLSSKSIQLNPDEQIELSKGIYWIKDSVSKHSAILVLGFNIGSSSIISTSSIDFRIVSEEDSQSRGLNIIYPIGTIKIFLKNKNRSPVSLTIATLIL